MDVRSNRTGSTTLYVQRTFSSVLALNLPRLGAVFVRFGATLCEYTESTKLG
jgi:hypothetical protein